MHLLPQPAWKESSVNPEFAHSNYTVSPHSAWRADVDYVRLLQLVNGDDYLKQMFLGRTEMLIPLLHRHYFQSVLSAMVYTRGGIIQNATTLSDDGSTLNFVAEEFAEKAGLQQVGV